MLKRLLNFYRPGIVLPVSGGMTPDKAADFGLIAFQHNANLQSPEKVNITTAGTNSTLTASQVRQAAIILAVGASGDFTITLPTTSALIDAFGPTLVTDGRFCKWLLIQNIATTHTGTLTAGDGSTTISGTATIATDTSRLFLFQIATASTIIITNFGSLSL